MCVNPVELAGLLVHCVKRCFHDPRSAQCNIHQSALQGMSVSSDGASMGIDSCSLSILQSFSIVQSPFDACSLILKLQPP